MARQPGHTGRGCSHCWPRSKFQVHKTPECLVKVTGVCFLHSVLVEMGNISASLGTWVSLPSVNPIKASQEDAACPRTDAGALVLVIKQWWNQDDVDRHEQCTQVATFTTASQEFQDLELQQILFIFVNLGVLFLLRHILLHSSLNLAKVFFGWHFFWGSLIKKEALA